MNSNKIFAWLAWSLCFLVALILSIRNLREPDLWWMLRTGEWIVQNGQVVNKDHFSFTFNGTPWINVKWLFEVILYFIHKISGPEGLLLLQTLVNGAIVVLIYRLYVLYKALSVGSHLVRWPTVGLILATYLTLFGWELRMMGRPEMVSHLFLLLFLWVYARFRLTNSKIIFLLIPLQVLWTNLHEAFGIGLVVMVVMLAGYWFEKNYTRKENFRHNFRWLLLATLGAIAAISLNPRGPVMILHPFEIFSQVGENKFTTELLSYKTHYYWQQKEAYVMLAMLVLGIVGFFVATPAAKTGDNAWKRALSSFGYGHAVVLLLFFYLGLTAHRNIVFFVLISAPFVALCLDYAGNLLWSRFPKLQKLSPKPVYGLLLLFGALAYAAVGSNAYYRHVNTREHYGLLVAPNKNPVGGSEFLKTTGDTTGNIYSDYLTSSYFMWENRPGFKTYVDLRDLDVFPAAFMTQTSQELFYPEIWEKANAKYKFQEVVLYQTIAQNLHQYLYQHPKWQLVFADPVTAIYRQTSAKPNQEDVFTAPTFRQPSGLATAISKIFWPFYQPEIPPHEPTDLLASRFYRMAGNSELAAKRALALSKNPEHRYQGLIELGEIYLGQAQKVDPQYQPVLLNQAQTLFDQAANEYADKPGGYGGQGKVAVLRGDATYARNQLDKAIDLSDKKDLDLYITMAQAIGIQINNGNNSYFDDWFKYMLQAYELDPENEQIKFIIGQTYCTRGDCQKAEKFLTGVTGYPGVSPEELQQVQQCKMNCRIK